MPNLQVYNEKGEQSGTIELPNFLQVEWNPDLVQQAVTAILNNKRPTVAHTKNRGEVRGGGKKPWKQKGTGRARVGSIRSPLWRGGGTTFGPRAERNFETKINKKMAQKALLSTLSKKAFDGEMKVIESLEIAGSKTKPVAQLLKKILERSSAVIIADIKNKNFRIAARNIPKIKVSSMNELNVYDLLSHKNVLMDKKIIENYGK